LERRTLASPVDLSTAFRRMPVGPPPTGNFSSPGGGSLEGRRRSQGAHPRRIQKGGPRHRPPFLPPQRVPGE